MKVADRVGPETGTASCKSNQYLPSSTYDSLLKLSALDECIQDALSIREKLADDIDRIFARHRETFSKIDRKPEALEAVKAAESAVVVQRRRLQKAAKKRDELRGQLQIRRDAIRDGRRNQKKEESTLKNARQHLSYKQHELQQLRQLICGQRRRVCSNVADIYPIDPVPEKSFAFTIRGLALPKASFDGFSSSYEDTVIAAALGHVVHVISLLSLYLSSLLPYPVSFMCSTSSIVDVLAMTTGSRTYPLFPRSGPRFRFEYGVFLLNKNIEMLTSRLDAKVLDIRHTLANLKFVLYLATAGEGELPARKAGGLKGLMLRKSLAVAAPGIGLRSGSSSTLVSGSQANLHSLQASASDQCSDILNDDSSSDAGSERRLLPLSDNAEGGAVGKANGKAHGAIQPGSRVEKGSATVGEALKETVRTHSRLRDTEGHEFKAQC